MESNQTGTEKFFGNIGAAIKNFFLAIWNGYIGILEKIFPHDFSVMIAIITLVIVALLFFRMFLNRK